MLRVIKPEQIMIIETSEIKRATQPSVPRPLSHYQSIVGGEF